MSEPPPKLTIALIGMTPLFRRDNLERVLALLEADPRLMPEKWSLEERGGEEYSRPAILERIDRSGGGPLLETALYLRRQRVVKHKAALELGSRPAIYDTFEPSPSPSDHPRIFELADRLADVFHPDWGAVHIWYGMRSRAQLNDPWHDDDERDSELMFRSSSLNPIDYYGSGPMGLAMRTYIGPHYLAQIGADRIESLPLVVDRLPWGGYRIDLVREPWSADLPTLLQTWRAGMQHLRGSILATPKIKNGSFTGREKAAAIDIGGTIR